MTTLTPVPLAEDPLRSEGPRRHLTVDAAEVEEALRRVTAAALVVGQVTRALYAQVERATAVGADPLEVLRASGLTRLPLDVPADDEMARRRRGRRSTPQGTDHPAPSHSG